jgi:hypothetical protein
MPRMTTRTTSVVTSATLGCEAHHARLEAERDQGADPEDPDAYRAEGIFWVPPEARYSELKKNARQPTIGQLVDRAMAAVERDNPSLKGVLPEDYACPALDKQRLGQLIDLVTNIHLGGGDNHARDVLGRVYVPCCSSGGIFVSSEEFIEAHSGRVGDISIYGQENVYTTWRLCKVNLAIRGIEGRIEQGDSFLNDGYPDLKADYILANPPFMGGLKISGNLGDRYRRWLEVAFEPYGGTADLCAGFYRRAYSLLKPGGSMGMVATNTIGQGDTRESGLAVILRQGGTITFARRFIKWPGAANVEVNLVAIRKRAASSELRAVSPILDGQPVPFISSRLDSEPEAEPKRLRQNEGKAFQGSIVLGMGFVLEPHEAEALIAKDTRNADCLFPYLNGEDLNSHPEQMPSRWVICFHDWDLERAKQYPDLLRIVEERVKPEREALRNRDDRRDRENWWRFARYRGDMRPAIAPLRRVLVRSRVSELHAFVFVPMGYVYSDATVVFAFDDDYHFALLQSSVHEVWLRKQASSLRTDIRYTTTDCFDTFPFPAEEYRRVASGMWRVEPLQGPFAEAARIGAVYHEHRHQIMLARKLSLTKIYNLFHDPACTDADIVRLRELHAEMDRAILACYGWEDLEPSHGFYQNDRGQMRFTISPEARREVLVRLLQLNLTEGG